MNKKEQKRKPKSQQAPLSLDAIKTILNSPSPEQALIQICEARLSELEAYSKPINYSQISYCVDERRCVAILNPDESGEFELQKRKYHFEKPQAVMEALAATPFPGGRVGIYEATAYTLLASFGNKKNDLQNQFFWQENYTGKKFLEGFIAYIAKSAEGYIGDKNIPVHLDDGFHQEGESPLVENGQLNPQLLNERFKKGLGCGFAKVFLKVLSLQLALHNHEDIAFDFLSRISPALPTRMLPDIKSDLLEFTSQKFIHQAMQYNSPVYILSGAHNPEAIVFTFANQTIDRQKIAAETGKMYFVSDLGSFSNRPRPESLAFNIVSNIFSANNIPPEEIPPWAISANLITYNLLEQKHTPRIILQ